MSEEIIINNNNEIILPDLKSIYEEYNLEVDRLESATFEVDRDSEMNWIPNIVSELIDELKLDKAINSSGSQKIGQSTDISCQKCAENPSNSDNIIIIKPIIIDENMLINNNLSINEETEYDNLSINEDVWENSFVDDNKFYINNKIARIFPIIKNFNNYSKLKIDDDSFSYITVREIADMITKLISYHLLYFNLNPQKMTIIDYTAGVGGNVLSFSKYFNYVYGIEIDKVRASYLENNINIYGFNNVKVINDCSINFTCEEMIKINPNIIFMDPPWGGTDYKNNDTLLLKLGNKSIEELIEDIIIIFSKHYLNENNSNQPDCGPRERSINPANLNNKLIVLKLPKNYDVEYFYNYIKNVKADNYSINIYLYILNKMIIIICELNYKTIPDLNNIEETHEKPAID